MAGKKNKSRPGTTPNQTKPNQMKGLGSSVEFVNKVVNIL